MKTTVVLSLATAALCAPTPDDGIKVPISKRQPLTRATGEVNMKTYLGHLQYTLNKYGKETTILKGITDIIKRQNAEEALQDEGQDELYYGNIQVGATSPQTFTCDFDTGSSDLFVPGPSCTTADGCTGTTRYDQDGTDEHNTTTVTYGSGQVSGENYFDSVTVAGLTAKHQNLISLTTATGFAGSDAAGLMGMAFQSIANSKQPPFFQTLMSEGVVSTKEFSFYLGRAADGTGQNSELTLGGRDSSKFTGAVTQVPLTAQTYWQVGLDKVLVNGASSLLSPLGLDPTKGNAAIDTGTTIILAPTAAALDIYSRIPGAFPVPLAAGGVEPLIFAYPCASNPQVAIQFAGKQFAVNPKDFNLGSLTANLGSLLGNSTLSSVLSGDSYCLGAIAGDDIDPTENLYVVGDTFLKNWYAIFNFVNDGGKPSVSFAKSV